MRIITGKYGGRRLFSPHGSAVRPTGDKVKGALFNILNNMVKWEDCVVLDVFCGTGSLGVEALSRGAEHVSFVDKSRESVQVAKDNLAKLGAENVSVICADALTLRPLGQKYNLVFMDPPYDQKIYRKTLENLHSQGMLADGFIAIWEMGAKVEEAIPEFCELVTERVYGKNKLVIMRGN
jgi:16S rRNA (guanine966-N2)-methyltransferase